MARCGSNGIGSYGDPARVADLQRANPRLVPEQLKVGARIVLPPKETRPIAQPQDVAIGPHEWQFWMLYGLGPMSEATRVYPGARFHAPNRPFSLLAVPVEHAAEFAEIRAQRAKTLVEASWVAEVPWLIAIEGIHVPRSVKDGSEVTEMETTIELQAIDPAPGAGKAWRLVSKCEQRDADGKPIAAGVLGSESGDGGGGVRSPWLLLAASLFGGALLLVRRRRTRIATA